MADPSIAAVRLPLSVENLLLKICAEQSQPSPGGRARRKLASIGEELSIELLNDFSSSSNGSINRYIMYMPSSRKGSSSSSSPACSPMKKTCFSPQRSPVHTVRWFGSPSSSTDNSVARVTSPQSGLPLSAAERDLFSMQLGASSMIPENPLRQTFLSKLELPPSISDYQMREAFSPQIGLPSLNSDNLIRQENNPHSEALSELEFRKAFLMLSYTGGSKLEDAISVDRIHSLKTLGMYEFESEIWKAYGHKFIGKSDRQMSVDWDIGKSHLYFCSVSQDGSYTFKGPYLKKEKTHLQRVLGDDNVLNVKFAEGEQGGNCTDVGSYCNGSRFNKIYRDGIFVGSRCYRFFVFKDGGKEEKKKDPTASAVKCYFVCMESYSLNDSKKLHILSSKTVYEARCLFMHAHMVATVAKYMARFSLILSKTIKLEVDLASVNIEEIPDIPCLDEYGFKVFNEDGDLLIHTDGTGFISEDLALRCPKNVYKGKHKSMFNGILFNSGVVEKVSELQQLESHYLEPPLLIQCRMFYKGSAVKGTLLVNRKLPPRTIQYRPSMLKVTPDPKLFDVLTANSLEIVGTSNKPKKAYLSRYLIVLLCHGGVPQKFFMDTLTNALEEAHSLHYNKHAAFRVSLNYGDMDDYIAALMIASGIPLDEPFLQHRLSILMREENKSLKGGRIPISDSYYLMGTADPTGTLKRDEVCIILDNGQISGKVLVFKHPGLHYGDIHVLNATYVKDMEDFVGNAKYAIFFPTKGHRSLTDEMAGSDLDGDMYFVSRNDQLLKSFKPSDPWVRSKYREHVINKKPTDPCTSMDSKEQVRDKKPIDFSAEELDHELFQLFLTTRFSPSRAIGMAADSWLAFMDRLLVLTDESADEIKTVNNKVLQLIDIYYDALDAPKSGMKIEIPDKLKPLKYPHYMERGNIFKSKSILGQIFDKAGSYNSEDQDIKEITLLPCFDVEVPESCFDLWNEHYKSYLLEMSDALNNSNKDTKNDRADEVIKKYKQILYGASDFDQTQRRIEEINDEAIAIYKISYENARIKRKAGTCQFAWKVAGKPLCMIYAKNQGDKSMLCSISFLRDIFC